MRGSCGRRWSARIMVAGLVAATLATSPAWGQARAPQPAPQTDDVASPLAIPTAAPQTAGAAVPPQPASPPQPGEKPGQFTIAVVGDSLAQGIGDGLANYLRHDNRFRILRKAKPATGLTRFDVFNWQEKLVELSNTETIDAAVVLMGTNDKQSIYLDNFRAVAFSTDDWNRIYRERFDSLVRFLNERNIWVIWVGLPVMQNRAFDKGMRTIDTMYMEWGAQQCVTYVPLYERTADEHGNYTPSGNDTAGRRKVLRANDGIHFTASGYELMAKYIVDAMRTDIFACTTTAQVH